MKTEQDKDDLIQLVQHQRSEAAAYWRQAVLWLAIGSAGAAIAFVSLAAKLPEPNFALRLFVPSLWCFLIGTVSAAACLPVAAFRAQKTEEHFAAAFNRQQAHNSARDIPEMISAPRSIAEQANVPRNALIKKGDASHEQAERAWKWRTRAHYFMIGLVSISAGAFLVGIAWPLIYVSRGGSLLPSH